MNTAPSTLVPDWLAQARTGRCHVDDLQPPGCLHAAFVRSPHAHAQILAIDTRLPEGALAVFTAEDLDPAWRPIPCIVPVVNRDGSQRADPPRTLLASGRARHEGEAVAMVIAATPQAARRAARALHVAWRPLAAVSDSAAALAPGAPLVWEQAPGNVCFDWELGRSDHSAAAFARAAHVVEMTLRNNRVVVAPLETRNALGWYDATSGRRVLVSGTQGVHWVRDVIARDVLGEDPATMEVVTPRVGGSFGTKIFVYPEQVLVLIAAQRLGAPVKWTSSRSEAFVSDTQGRDHHTQAAMALDAQGRILAVRADTLSNLGAHLSNYAPFNATTCGAPLLGGCYRVGHVHTRVRGVLTHTPPVDSYRGAGRPEANYVVERLIDRAASALGIDRAELRQRNLIRAADLPYTTATGLAIDSGLFEDNMAQALAAADYAGFALRRAQSDTRGLLRGIGMANFVEANGGLALARLMEPGGKPLETARLSFLPDGWLRLDVGTQASGQGHACAYARVVGQALGWPEDRVRVHQGRTDRLRQGTGTGGSKSLLSGATAILAAVAALRERVRDWAVGHWNLPPETVAWHALNLAAGPHSLTLPELVARAAGDPADAHPFDTETTATIRTGTYGNGCHVCEVEVDPQTGCTRILSYVAVNDFGALVVPELVLSQMHGGIAQGIGQALHEECRFDHAQGQLLSADFGSYHLPQASQMPPLDIRFNGSRCTTNALGTKGCGEAGTSAAPPAVLNAVQHALAGRTTAEVQMPATPQRVWRLLQQGAA